MGGNRSHTLYFAPLLFIFGVILSNTELSHVIPIFTGFFSVYVFFLAIRNIKLRGIEAVAIAPLISGAIMFLVNGWTSSLFGIGLFLSLMRIGMKKNLVLRSLFRGLGLGLGFSLGLSAGGGPLFLYIFGIQVMIIGTGLSMLNALVRSEIFEIKFLDRSVGELYIRIFISILLMFAVVFSPITGIFFSVKESFLLLTLLGGSTLLYGAVRLVYMAVPAREISKLILMGAAFYIFAHISILT